MESLIEGLPPEIASRIHPDWQKNEAEYWVQRDGLLCKYADQWVGFADGKVIVSGTSPVEVFHAAQSSGQHPFVTCVGHEHEPNRIRRVSFPYDTRYPNEALPVITVEFRKQSGSLGLALDHVIPDTGADASALPWLDCEQILSILFGKTAWLRMSEETPEQKARRDALQRRMDLQAKAFALGGTGTSFLDMPLG